MATRKLLSHCKSTHTIYIEYLIGHETIKKNKEKQLSPNNKSLRDLNIDFNCPRYSTSYYDRRPKIDDENRNRDRYKKKHTWWRRNSFFILQFDVRYSKTVTTAWNAYTMHKLETSRWRVSVLPEVCLYPLFRLEWCRFPFFFFLAENYVTQQILTTCPFRWADRDSLSAWTPPPTDVSSQ